jgi:AcrR family transcriptional regulator
MKDKRTHIIETATDLFARKGYEGTSIREIAERASVNLAMVNYYFGSKEKLFENIVEYKSAVTRGLLDEILKNDKLSSIEKIYAIIDSYVEKLFTHRSFHRLIYQELILDQREELQNSIVNHLAPNSVIIKRIIETGIKNGEFKKVDVELTLASLMGTINQVLLSRKFCNKIMNKDDDYVPYDDIKFRKRVRNHLRQLMDAHLLNN